MLHKKGCKFVARFHQALLMRSIHSMKSYADECVVVRLMHVSTHSHNAIKLCELSEVSNVHTGPHEANYVVKTHTK